MTIGEYMNSHQYRTTLQYLGGRHAGPELHAPLTFHADNHDDLFDIIQRVRQADMFDADTSAALERIAGECKVASVCLGRTAALFVTCVARHTALLPPCPASQGRPILPYTHPQSALAMGMKLFSEVMLKHRQDPLLAPILWAYRDYIGAFKQRVAQGAHEGGQDKAKD